MSEEKVYRLELNRTELTVLLALTRLGIEKYTGRMPSVAEEVLDILPKSACDSLSDKLRQL